ARSRAPAWGRVSCRGFRPWVPPRDWCLCPLDARPAGRINGALRLTRARSAPVSPRLAPFTPVRTRMYLGPARPHVRRRAPPSGPLHPRCRLDLRLEVGLDLVRVLARDQVDDPLGDRDRVVGEAL